MSKGLKKKAWCVVFDLHHYTKQQAFDLGYLVGDYELSFLHGNQIAIIMQSLGKAVACAKEIDTKLAECDPPFHLFYALVEHDEVNKEEQYWREEANKRAQAKMQRDKERDERARAWKAERGMLK